MTTFDDRERAQEAKFAHDAELNFKAEARRNRLLGDAQRLLAQDAACAFLYQPQWVTVAAKNLRGLWKDMPVFVNDLAALSWA